MLNKDYVVSWKRQMNINESVSFKKKIKPIKTPWLLGENHSLSVEIQNMYALNIPLILI